MYNKKQFEARNYLVLRGFSESQIVSIWHELKTKSLSREKFVSSYQDGELLLKHLKNYNKIPITQKVNIALRVLFGYIIFMLNI